MQIFSSNSVIFAGKKTGIYRMLRFVLEAYHTLFSLRTISIKHVVSNSVVNAAVFLEHSMVRHHVVFFMVRKDLS